MLSREHPVDLIEIIWDDADSDSGWESEIDENEELVHTVAFLIKKTKAAYYTASTWCYVNDEVHYNGRLRIPLGMVKSFKVLSKGE